MITIGVCTSAMETNIGALLTRLRETSNANIKFVELPYNDVGSYRLDSRNMNGIILCHSIHNRRFAITDVMDALYDEFLPRAMRVFGRDNVAVIGHDFKWPLGEGESGEGHAREKETQMTSFRVKQPTTFQCSGVTLICGRLDGRVEMDADDWQLLQHFVDSVKPIPFLGNEKHVADRREIFFALVLSICLFVLMVVLLATDWLDDAGKASVTIVILVIEVPEGSWIIMQVVYTNGNRENRWYIFCCTSVYTNGNRENRWYICTWWLAPPRFWWHVFAFLFNCLKSLCNSGSPENTPLSS
ncbi:uncharacterized protein [Diadema setosum]|uniref:uncharacterized protein n=1 Tax=Diadema setosum TaxID=31175 RepID=UPI003B3B7CFF